MKSIYLFSFLLLIIFSSCRKEPNPVPVPPTIQKVSKISSGNGDTQTFKYNSLGMLTNYTSEWRIAPGGTTKITNTLLYNGNKLVKITNNVGYILYTYQHNLPEKAESFFFDNKPLSTLFFHYTAQKKLDYLIEEMALPKPDDAEATKLSFQYDVAGNVARMDYAIRLPLATNFTPQFSKQFEGYDDKINPEPTDVLGFFINELQLHKNNPLKVNNLDTNGNLLGYSRFEYTYNAAGYPLQRKQFIAVGTVEQPPIIFQYTY